MHCASADAIVSNPKGIVSAYASSVGSNKRCLVRESNPRLLRSTSSTQHGSRGDDESDTYVCARAYQNLVRDIIFNMN
ncbi:hypothetical protein EVAR_29939_1 [Eumeta japonica]|uniref:Uncharacterized protein n=1 Tax=Eumeta variegata TaxID=151549 RepID=A0A4C1VF46_EUMVA|nr:hypothetical protein EVAR_29939_1 [Eumeta japonica]